jgi:hypothetical protein
MRLEETSKKCIQFAKDEADKLGREENKPQHWDEEQRDLLANAHIIKRGKDYLLSTDGKTAHAPDQQTLNEMADRYIRHGEEKEKGKQKKEFLEMVIRSINRNDTTSIRGLGEGIWNLVTDVTEARVQLHTTVASKAEQLEHYTDDSGTETAFGAIKTEELVLGSVRVAGATTIEGLGDMIDTMSQILQVDNRAWTTIITTNTKLSRQQLEKAGYQTIAIAKRKNVSISVKIGELAKITEANEVLGKLDTMRKAELRLKITTFPDNLIKAVTTKEIQGEDWNKARDTQVTAALQWMNNPQTLMGIATENCTKKLMAIGIQESVAKRIRRQSEQWMLEEYHKDAKVKAHKCQIEREKLRRQANKQKIQQLKAEKAHRQKIRLSLKKRRREIAGKMKSRVRLSRKQTEHTEARTESTRETQKRPKKRQKTRSLPKITRLQDAQTQTRTDKEQEILGRGHRTKKRKRRD